MKKLIAALLLASTSTVAFADGFHGGHYPHGGYNHGYHGPIYRSGYHSGYGDILVPMAIGGVIGYAINEANRQPTVVYQQAPTVIYQQQPTVTYQKCTAWVETMDQYGVITKTRTCY